MENIFIVVEEIEYDTGTGRTTYAASTDKELCNKLAKRLDEIKDKRPFKEDAKYYVTCTKLMKTPEDYESIRCLCELDMEDEEDA